MEAFNNLNYNIIKLFFYGNREKKAIYYDILGYKASETMSKRIIFYILICFDVLNISYDVMISIVDM